MSTEGSAFPGPAPVQGGHWRMLDTVAVDSGQMEIIDPNMRSGDSVIFSPGLGDDLYEVWVREVLIGTLDGTSDTPEDWRIAEVRMTLITQPDLDRWNSG